MQLSPKEYNRTSIGHSGFFKAACKDWLWRVVVNWLSEGYFHLNPVANSKDVSQSNEVRLQST